MDTTPTIPCATCYECGYTSTDTLDAWNGYGTCPRCQNTTNSTWILSDGTTIPA